MYAIVDIECNGAGFRKEKAIEIAILLYDGHEVVDQLFTLVNPNEEITPFVQKLTGITPKMVKTAPKFHEMAKRIIEMTEGATLVGHNVDFDYRILRQSFKELGYDFKINTIDTLSLSKKLIPDIESYSLSKLCKSLGIPHTDIHRAGGDARATLELFKLLISKDIDNDIIQSHQDEAKSKSYINKVNELTEDLPVEKGILYFQNKKGQIVLCEYADNIYKKARKIFSSKSAKKQIIQQEVEQIHYEFTGTDIIAQLIFREKELKPQTRNSFFIVFNEESKEFSISTKKQKENIRLFGFKSYFQAEIFLKFLQNRENGLDFKKIKKEISFSKRNELWIGKGRTLGEKSFLAFRQGKFIGYGFYELYHQVLSWDKILNLMIPVKSLGNEIKNEMQIAYLRNEFKIVEIEK